MWPNDRQQTGRKFATCRQILVAKAKILVANAPVSVAISSPALQCVRTITPKRGWDGHFHTFAVFLSTPTSTRCHCLLECREGLFVSPCRVYYICNWRFLIVQIIIFTIRRIKRFLWGLFLWARLICVLSANSQHFKLFFRATLTRAFHATSGSQFNWVRSTLWLKKCKKNFLKPFQKVEYTDLVRVVSHNLELLWIWTLVGSPVRIICIFAVHTGIFPASIADAVSAIIVVNILRCD